MPDDLAINVENLSKVYKLYNSPVDRLKESLHPLRKTYHRDFYALNDVSFEIRKGESVGIIGKNGSGKSTLLKILTGVLTPTSGTVTVNGKVSALLELGAGFNPELSGVENVYFNGMLLGYNRSEMDERLDEILSFADIGDFVYQPVKTYSSGMFIRLAFAVAVNVDPDILIVDEALSVGDIRFQRKCFSKIERFQSDNKTILFVSHGLDTVNMLCETALLLDSGKIRHAGYSKKITRIFQIMMMKNDISPKYKINNLDETIVNDNNITKTNTLYNGRTLTKLAIEKLANWDTSKKAEIIEYGILNSRGEKVTILESGEKYTIYSRVLVYVDLDQIHFGFPIKNIKGLLLFAVSSENQKIVLKQQKRGSIIEGNVEITMWLAPGNYFLSFRAATREEDYDELSDIINFTVIGDCELNPASIVNLEPKVSLLNISVGG